MKTGAMRNNWLLFSGGLLTVVLVTLKLINKIDWSWWWILSLWVVETILAIIVLVLVIMWGDKLKGPKCLILM